MRIVVIIVALVGIVAFGLEMRSRGRANQLPHAYSAPHGGTIVRLGRHEFHLELVHDAAAGKLTAYLLDRDSKIAVRGRNTSFDITVTGGVEPRVLTFNAIPDPAVRSTAADATRFEAQADWLKGMRQFEGQLTFLKIGSTTFLRVPIHFPAGDESR